MFYITTNPDFFTRQKNISPWVLSADPEFKTFCLCDLVIATGVNFYGSEDSTEIFAGSELAFGHLRNPHINDLVGRADGRLCTKLFPPRLASDEGQIIQYARKVFFLSNGMIFCSLSKKGVNHKK